MAVGDVVSGIGSTTTAFSFQPASGVEVCITQCSNYNAWIVLMNTAIGINDSYVYQMGTDGKNGNQMNMKMMIKNTNYIGFHSSSGAKGTYSGIQIK
jgi:hypothetical protein